MFLTGTELKLQMYSGMSYQDILTMIRNVIYLSQMSPGRSCKQSYHLGTYNSKKISKREPDLKLQKYSGISYQDILTMIRNVIYLSRVTGMFLNKKSPYMTETNVLKAHPGDIQSPKLR